MLRAFPVPPDLRPWVDGAVAVRLAAPGLSRFPAMSRAMLTVRLVTPGGPGTAPVLCSPITFHTLSTAPTVYAHPGALTALGLVLHPAAAVGLLALAGGGRVDAVWPWADLAGRAEAERVEDAVLRAPCERDQLAALADSVRRTLALVSRGEDLARAQRLCTAVGWHGAQAAGMLGIGRRQLERRCHALLGLAPKPYQRLVRFQGALAMALSAGSGERTGGGAALALEAGYADQSHLGRDLRRLAGMPLGPLLSAARPEADWWSLASHRLMVAAGAGPAAPPQVAGQRE